MEETELNKALNSVGKLITEKLRRNAKVEGFSAAGKLYDSWRYDTIEKDLKIYAEKYAGALSRGSTPVKKTEGRDGKLNRIREWLRIKGIRPIERNKVGGYKFKKLKGTRAFESMVFAMGRNISKNGLVKRYNYKGGKFIELTIQQTKKQIDDMLSEAYRKDIVNQLNNIGK